MSESRKENELNAKILNDFYDNSLLSKLDE